MFSSTASFASIPCSFFSGLVFQRSDFAMELRDASRAFCLFSRASKRGLFRSSPFGLHRRHIGQVLHMKEDIRSGLHAVVQSSNSSLTSPRHGDTSTPRKRLCKIIWIVEADVLDGHLILLTGDPVTLGGWEPDVAILLSPSSGSTDEWRTEIKVPCGIHFKYNYFVKDQKHPSAITWKEGPEYSLSVPVFRKDNNVIIVRDSWLQKRTKKPSLPSWGSWMLDFGHANDCLEHQGNHVNSSGIQSIIETQNGALVNQKTLPIDSTQEDSSQSAEKFESTADNHMVELSIREQPIEEPWLFQSTGCFNLDLSNKGNAAEKNLVGKSLDKAETEKVELLEDDKRLLAAEPASTIILINSSVCTMQRIAVLEDEKLVEILLEPVKNNVQCDSIYLGVVTKLVPHMGGAFVDIGISRPSLMSIKSNREPFVYPPFSNVPEGLHISSSSNDESEEHLDLNDLAEYRDEEADGDSDDDTEIFLESVDIGHESAEVQGEDIGELEEDENDNQLEDEEEEDNVQTEVLRSSMMADLPFSLQLNFKESNKKAMKVNKWSHVSKGTKVIVQVIKEGLGTKGPALSPYPSLRSRFWILISRCDKVGVSKKIIGSERSRLKDIAKTLQPPGIGLTVRTVAAGHSLEELQKDLNGLLSTWKGIIEHAKSAALAAEEGVEGAVPVMLHRAMGQTLLVVQDYFNDKVKKMIVDSSRTYHEVTSYLQEIAPELCNRVELYEKRNPIFDEYNIEEEIDSILCKRVSLPNGGSLVIEQTEALVSIDVNGGHSMLGQGTSQEEAVLEVNLAAAKQIARELRLRDIGGIIVVDFIDMVDDSNRRLVYEEVKRAVERDKSMVRISELSKLGLMEITRKRVRPSVSFLISEPCICCHSSGRIEALDTSFSKIEREICRFLANSDRKPYPENPKSWPKFVLSVDRYMCNFLTSGKKTKLAVLSSSLKVWILLKVARGFPRGSFEVRSYEEEKENEERRSTASRLRSSEARTYFPSSKLTLFPIKRTRRLGKQ